MNDTILEVKNLTVEFTDNEQSIIAVDKINFQLKRGETLGIVGESGSGKSVTSLAIMGLLPSSAKITESEIWFKATENEQKVNLLQLTEQKRRDYRGGKIGMIFQEPMSSLNPVYNIGFQITEAIKLHQNVHEAEARRKAIALLQEVKLLPSDGDLKKQYLENLTRDLIPDDKQILTKINQQKQQILKRYPHELSGGQLQRVMIAMAISCNPSILIADEPTTALDVTVQATILDLLKELCHSRQMSLIFITHDLAVIANMAEAIAVMREGKIVEYGKATDIFFKPQHPYSKALLACRPRLDQNVDELLPTVDDFLHQKEDRIPVRAVKHPKISKKEALITIEDLKVGFAKKWILGAKKEYFWAVKDVSFQVYQGETLGLVGESGCGKSTLARTILRLIPAYKGKIGFLGENLAILKERGQRLRNIRREMQIIFQNPYNSLNPRMSIGRAIMEPMIVHKSGNQKTRRERVAYLLERVGLNPDWFNRYPHELSGGQRQRVCIARALALQPQLVICDESVSALDVSVQAQVLNLLKELQAEFGLTYIFISHDLRVVKFISDRIMVMNKGEIEEIGAAAQIIDHPQKDYTRKLIASIPQFPEPVGEV
jgi:peptide/nickel transport system ATP-binding protein